MKKPTITIWEMPVCTQEVNKWNTKNIIQIQNFCYSRNIERSWCSRKKIYASCAFPWNDQRRLDFLGCGNFSGSYTIKMWYNDEGYFLKGSYWGDHDWEAGDRYDSVARKAYEALLRVSLLQPTSDKFQDFADRVKERAYQDYNYTITDGEEVRGHKNFPHDLLLRTWSLSWT